MGEVFLAHDERLDREVALKRIRAEGEVSPDRRERFRREARIAARLSHPSIVQVYDVLTESDTDFIVLEFVEGETLRSLLRGGPLDVGQASAIALDVARGLEEAHRHGIVHRDLKTENVLVTPSGRAKIADFGIAKRFLRDATEESLTGHGRVLGTFRVMSPEQARGEAVDHRSDLFSLGVLLYEMLAGRSPFEAENELATLQRILSHRQTLLRDLVPRIPEDLSNLVDHLLEKDPHRRPRNAGEVARTLESIVIPREAATLPTLVDPIALSWTLRPEVDAASVPADSNLTVVRWRPRSFGWVVLLLVAGLAAGAYFALRPTEEPITVAVLAPELVTPSEDGELDLLASGVRVALLRGLVSLQGISPKAFDEVDAVSGSAATVARAVAADEVVRSRLSCRPEVCQVLLQRLRGEDGTILWAESFEVPADDYNIVANAVAGQIGRGYPGYKVRLGMSDLTIKSEDLRAFVELRRRFDRREDLEPLLEALSAIRARSPRFLDVYLLEGDVARHRFHVSRNPEDLARALDLAEAARDLAPDDPQPLFLQFDTALAGRDFARAESALEELERLVPGDVRVQDRRARLLDAQGRSGEALALLRSASRRHPSWKRLASLARMEYRQGETAAARHHLKELLRRFPDNIDGLSLLAEVELASGDRTRAAALYRDLVRRSPGSKEWTNLGVVYLIQGNYVGAADACRRALDKEPGNPFFTLNLADAYLLPGRRSEAVALYERVLALIEEDPAASGAQFLTVKAQALAHLGRGQEAVAAVQEALRLAPNEGPTAYEAALVYSILREEVSALHHAKRALGLGFQPVWFDFPWFDPMWSNPEFKNLIFSARRPATS
jgi:serine/threonine-protein kinase